MVGGVTGAMGDGVGEIVLGGGTCDPDSIGLPGAGFAAFPLLSCAASGEVPPAVINLVPAFGRLM
jgi:hypothetical protein